MSDEIVNTASTENTAENTEPTKAIPRGLIPWKPGQSGNPGGRPKKKWLTEAFEELLEQKLSDPVLRKAFIEAHWEKLLSKTVVSSMLMEKMLDRTEGKLTQPVEVSGELTLSIAERMKRARERNGA